MRKETQCVHSGTFSDPEIRGINTPIFPSSAFAYLDTDARIYPRYFNTPNQQAVVNKLCALEGAEDGVVFSSGMAAIASTILSCCGRGEHIVLQRELYGGTHAFTSEQLPRLGISFTFVATAAEEVTKAIRPETRLLLIESPTNPLLSVIDIRRVAEIGKAKGIRTAIDNTFATPINQNPLALGIDIVLHSGTKYLGGHSDLCCGAALASRELCERIRHTAYGLGGSLNALTCHLLERSLKTLSLRVERQTENAQKIAEHLCQHQCIQRVYYPGLAAHPGQAIARSQMKGFGAMLSFELQPDFLDCTAFQKKLQLIKPALSLGGVESTICAPATTSHQKMSPAERERIGVRDSLLRLSVGIEHVADLIADLDQALQ